MEKEDEFIRRLEDLSGRAASRSVVTHTQFLTPAEQYRLSKWLQGRADVQCVTGCGVEGCERNAAFFLPGWMDPADLDYSEYIGAVIIKAGFGEPGHRDYMGSILGLGIKREWLGDIIIDGSTASVLSMNPVSETLVSELTHVSRYGVRVRKAELSEIKPPEKKTKEMTFTVVSPRFDAVLSGVFGISRTLAEKQIRAGLASLNYEICMKPDAEVREGAVISLKGKGKAVMKEAGGKSRKGRTVLTFSKYV
ncbi:MAG: RNA-binding protein [Oscillospiraceae bacterium]|jgi:RNA-binding protein YlmH